MTQVIRPAARDDIIRQFRWYLIDKDTPETAFRFLAAVEESIDQLLRMPGMGSPKALRNPTLSGLRVWPVQGFDDVRIFYQVLPDVLRVIRVLHGKRNIDRILEHDIGREYVE